MSKKEIYLGNNKLKSVNNDVNGDFVEIDGELFYIIRNYNKINDFFISVISNSDHWMFISSNGSLSAGRENRDNALFPYYTEDKIHDYRGLTGSSSHFFVEKDDKNYLWEPFTAESEKVYAIERNILKSFYGNKVIFQEINKDLGVSFQYGWYNSDRFGFVKKSKIKNESNESKRIYLLDGIRNILPAGSDYNFQNEYSNLLDAYKKSELLSESKIGLFTLSSIPVDRAEPSESLYATTVWSNGIDDSKVLISNIQTDLFRSGQELETEYDIRAKRGAYFVNSDITLKIQEEKEWYIVSEINQDSAAVSNLNNFLQETENVSQLVDDDIKLGTNNLKSITASADGLQITDTTLCYARHYSNTLYNVMRGGIFANNYTIEAEDFKSYLWQTNKLISKEFSIWMEKIPNEISYSDLLKAAEKTSNRDLLRITYEYLPLTFSRRHGDPSRPWNLFTIKTKNNDGTIKYNYEGNWRDIFQNWEALCFSYPEFTEGIISKFVNASTIDGYNPYRITRNGIDWECPDPNDPWSYIGYWGDHQIIYLQKLLELSHNFHPEKLDELFLKKIFTYANVPYQIKPYEDILQTPKDTIEFNEVLNEQIHNEVEHLGSDARLLKERKGQNIYKVNLTEKILVTLLSKLCNFIPGAGIWLNTQRPEWNDANNALVGNGTSMVTLYYLRRFLRFIEDRFDSQKAEKIYVSEEVVILFKTVYQILFKNRGLLRNGVTSNHVYDIAYGLGKAHSKYRSEIYVFSFSGEQKKIQKKELVNFTSLCLRYIDHSIRLNRRKDGLYHAYNLISIKENRISIRNLYEMLEGQVAILSSGYLSTKDSLSVLNALKKSKMFREDQYSYMLYPDRQLPRFTEKNTIPAEKIQKNKLLKELVKRGDESIIIKDKEGTFYFNHNMRNAGVLSDSLDRLRLNVNGYSQLVEEDKERVLQIYEDIFDHQSFTGRSGTFYGYEGLGSIYWHMVSKLLLATQECYYKALDEKADRSVLSQFKNHYYEIKAGIGLYKSPELYGAFPTDAYSHTPGNSGVKQPGLTGQVKEDVISRLGEIGVQIKAGKITYNTSLLNDEEILKESRRFEYINLDGKCEDKKLDKDQIGFTFCQVPVVVNFSGNQKIVITFSDNKKLTIKGLEIDQNTSQQIFRRTGEVKFINIYATKVKDNN